MLHYVLSNKTVLDEGGILERAVVGVVPWVRVLIITKSTLRLLLLFVMVCLKGLFGSALLVMILFVGDVCCVGVILFLVEIADCIRRASYQWLISG